MLILEHEAGCSKPLIPYYEHLKGYKCLECNKIVSMDDAYEIVSERNIGFDLIKIRASVYHQDTDLLLKGIVIKC